MEVHPPDYDFYCSPEPTDSGGGVALIFRNCHKCTPFDTNNYVSFEVLMFKTGGSTPALCVVVHRHPWLDVIFLTEFSEFLSSAVVNRDKILISGDLNFYVDLLTNVRAT